MAKCENGNERFTIYLDGDVHDLLKEYAFVSDIRTPNTAAREIVTDFLIEWRRIVSSEK